MHISRCWLRPSTCIAGARIDLAASVVDADQMFSALETKLPTQTNRSNEQIEWQQFATPPRLAWLAARACAFVADELMLEPSAGTGCSRSGRQRLTLALPSTKSPRFAATA